MTTTTDNSPAPTATEANREMREFASGPRSWTAEELTEFARLRQAWLEAATREVATAA
ncbi:hypothetical protein QNO07_14940 [Streptomyces sp. 549]|uniref:hypothetical protein n=1 Tax=Streptomyces sp. 549 TaxID=3049076 RepID=UPI0024C26B01|nr:hypothetical protein [Streptomyces sp. 549]MDK1474701.1 hypothetical protein [Streptomyces sp. 549]